MSRRRQVQQQHERAVVSDFLVWLNPKRRTRYSVIAEPNPPEAIIKSVRATSWVEVTDVFWTDAWARDLISSVTPGEKHVPVGRGPFVNMDEIFASRFVKVLSGKLAKRSYLPVLKQYGRGYLLVSAQSPYFNASTVDDMRRHWSSRKQRTDLGCFREVHLAYPSSNSRGFLRWRI